MDVISNLGNLETEIMQVDEVNNQPPSVEAAGPVTEVGNVTSFENISRFLASHKYAPGMNLNQKRTLRKAATNFCLLGGKLYYTGKSKKDRRLVVLDEEGKRQVFRDCHGNDLSAGGCHWGQKKTLEKIESSFFWRGMVKDVVNWIQECEHCQQKEEKRSQLSKKLKTSNSVEDDGSGVNSLEAPNDPVADGTNSMLSSSIESTLESCKFQAEQLQMLFEDLGRNEQELLRLSERAQLDVDEMLDYLLSKIIKLISGKKREMRAQIERSKTRALLALENSRKQVENKLKAVRKLVSDAERAVREGQQCTVIQGRALSISLPEVPSKEDVGGVWSVFHIERTSDALTKIIDDCGSVTKQPPYRVSSALQLPSALRLNFASVDDSPGESAVTSRTLRVYHCCHEPTINDVFHVDENRIHVLSKPFTKETDCYVHGVVPHQVYAFYVSYLEEGAREWSPWSFPFLASTSLPGFSWDSTNSDWLTSTDQKEASTIVSASMPIYSSSAQFFPGCRINFTLKGVSSLENDDGFALVEQWAPGGNLCTDGTLFVSVLGHLYVSGKFVQAMDPLLSGTTVIIDCHPRVETVAEGLLLQLIVTCGTKSLSIKWVVRNQMSSLYFGAQFRHQGTQLKVD